MNIITMQKFCHMSELYLDFREFTYYSFRLEILDDFNWYGPYEFLDIKEEVL